MAEGLERITSMPVDPGPGRTRQSPSRDLQYEGGSFRDPAGNVYIEGGRVFRVIHPLGLTDWSAFSSSPLIDELQREKLIVRSFEPEDGYSPPNGCFTDGSIVIEHERVPWISYPYEWPFGMLKDAALLHLDILDRALRHNLVLKDATPFNVQFLGQRPIFIDVLSFAVWNPGDPWAGYNQFCRMFLYPLMLQAFKGVPFQSWLRSDLGGIDAIHFSRLFGFRDLFRRGVLQHVKLHSWLQRRMADARFSTREQVKASGFSKSAIEHNVRGLRRIISGLTIRMDKSAWLDYTQTHSYTEQDRAKKETFVREVVEREKLGLVWDLGCNTGTFSRIVSRGASTVVAMDADRESVESLYQSLKETEIDNIVPAVVDLGNPSPNQGWAGNERRSLMDRGKPDLILCLALIHHLRITGNVPIHSVIEWLASLTDRLIVEFVDKKDPMVERLLLNKEDTYGDYTLENFEQLLGQQFRIEKTLTLKGSHRTMYFARSVVG